jgi:vacuolar-type H+-ATPase subunit F/Vma7
MNQARLYIDEDAEDRAVVDGLRILGVDVLTVTEAEMEGESDDKQLAFATSVGRILYTLNVEDFCRLHTDLLSAGGELAGIVVIPRQRYSVGEKIRRLADRVASISAEEMRNRLNFL